MKARCPCDIDYDEITVDDEETVIDDHDAAQHLHKREGGASGIEAQLQLDAEAVVWE